MPPCACRSMLLITALPAMPSEHIVIYDPRTPAALYVVFCSITTALDVGGRVIS